MPPKKPQPVVDAPQEEVSIFYVRVKGSSETLQRSINTIAEALAGVSNAPAAPKQVNGRSRPAVLPAPDTLDVEQADHQETEQPAASAAPKGAPKPRKPPKFDSSLAVTPFKAFAAERNPQTVDEKYLVACLWLQESAGIGSYGASQVFTCFRAVGWAILDDFTQPMRNMKLRKSYFQDTDNRKEWKLNDHGLDEARKIKHQI